MALRLGSVVGCAAALCVALFACGGGEKTRSTGAPPEVGGSGAGSGSTANEPARVAIDPGELQWQDPTKQVGQRRVALLVAANDYRQSSWNVAFALPSVQDLAQVFQDKLAFDEVKILSSDRVYADNIRASIDGLTAGMSGKDNLLYVHWIGHGFSIDGREHLLTYHSLHDGAKYTSTLAYDKLAGWVRDRKQQLATSGGQLDVAVVVDACRVRGLAAPGKVSDHVPSVDVEAFSAEIGRPAEARPGVERSAFTAAMVDALKYSSGQKITLRPALATATEVCASQGPEITTGDNDVTLLNAANIRVSVRAVDARSKKELPNAIVELNGVQKSGRASFDDLAETAEGYDLRVRAEGYFWRSDTVKIDRTRSGAELTVPLAPEFVVLTGRIQVEGDGAADAVRIFVTGDFQGKLIADYHASATARVGSGTFVLRLPRVAGTRSLGIEVNGKEVGKSAFDMATMPAYVVKSDGVNVTTFDFATISVEGSGRVKTVVGGAVKAVAFDTSVQFDFASLTESDFIDAPGWSFYQEVKRFAQGGNYALAERNLSGLLNAGKVKPQGISRLETLRSSLAVAYAMQKAADAYKEGNLAASAAILAASKVATDKRVREKLRVVYLDLARRQHAQSKFTEAIATLEKLEPLAKKEDAVSKQLAQVYTDWARQAYQQALTDGKWEPVKDVLAEVRRKYPHAKGLSVWYERVERESISPASRKHYNNAVAAMGRGELEEAWELFNKACAEGCNDNYRKLIDEQLKSLRAALFPKYNAIGAERLSAGQLNASFAAYLQAYHYDPIVRSTLEYLLTETALKDNPPPEAEKLKREWAATPAKAAEPTLHQPVPLGSGKSTSATSSGGKSDWRKAGKAGAEPEYGVTKSRDLGDSKEVEQARLRAESMRKRMDMAKGKRLYVNTLTRAKHTRAKRAEAAGHQCFQRGEYDRAAYFYDVARTFYVQLHRRW